MSLAAAVRFWMGEHPGWHLASEIADGMQACGINRRKAVKALCNMADAGLVEVSGSRRHMRYTIDRPSRDHMQQERENV